MQEDKLEKGIIVFQGKDDSALGHLERGQVSMDGTVLGAMDWLWMVWSRRGL